MAISRRAMDTVQTTIAAHLASTIAIADSTQITSAENKVASMQRPNSGGGRARPPVGESPLLPYLVVYRLPKPQFPFRAPGKEESC